MTDARERLPSQEALKELFEYDPETGVLIWKRRPQSMFSTLLSHNTWNTRYAGKAAFTHTTKDGYKDGCIQDVKAVAHRVIWKLVYGYEPDEVDHINGIRDDNRLVNLRHVDSSDNKKNQRVRKDNKSGVVGVRWHNATRKWSAFIGSRGKKYHLGLFDDINDAIKTRRQAEADLGFHRNHGRAA